MPSVTVGLRCAAVSDRGLPEALAEVLGTEPGSFTCSSVRSCLADDLEAYGALERLRAIHAGEAIATADLLGSISDASLRQLETIWDTYQSDVRFDDALRDRLGEGVLEWIKPLFSLACADTVWSTGDALMAAESAAELRHSTPAETIRSIAAMPVAMLGAVGRAFAAQGTSTGKAHASLPEAIDKAPHVLEALRRLLRCRVRYALVRLPTPPPTALVSDPSMARRAKRLHAAGGGHWCGTDEDAFIEVIGFADAEEAVGLRYEYAMRFGRTLRSAVAGATRGELSALLIAFLHPPLSALAPEADTDLAEAQARSLYRASEGRGYDGAEWVRTFGGASAAQLVAIMRIMARHGLSLPSLIRQLSAVEREPLLVRCRWAAAHAQRAPPLPLARRLLTGHDGDGMLSGFAPAVVAAAAAASSVGRMADGGPAASPRISGEGDEALFLWASLIAVVSAPAIVEVQALYARVCATGDDATPPDLYEDIEAHAPTQGGARTLLLILLGRGGNVGSEGSEGRSVARETMASDAIDDCPGADVYADGPADETLAEQQVEELLGLLPSTTHERSDQWSRAGEGGGRGGDDGIAEAALLGLLGHASFAHLAAVESCMLRHAANGTARHCLWPVAELSGGSVGVLMTWAAGFRIHPLVRLVLETRHARAMVPAVRRAARLREVARRLFGRSPCQLAISKLLCDAPSHELPLLAHALSASSSSGAHEEAAAVAALVAGGVEDPDARGVLLQMLEPRADTRLQPFVQMETAARLHAMAAAVGVKANGPALVEAVGGASDAQLCMVITLMDARRGPLVPRRALTSGTHAPDAPHPPCSSARLRALLGDERDSPHSRLPCGQAAGAA